MRQLLILLISIFLVFPACATEEPEGPTPFVIPTPDTNTEDPDAVEGDTEDPGDADDGPGDADQGDADQPGDADEPGDADQGDADEPGDADDPGDADQGDADQGDAGGGDGACGDDTPCDEPEDQCLGVECVEGECVEIVNLLDACDDGDVCTQQDSCGEDGTCYGNSQGICPVTCLYQDLECGDSVLLDLKDGGTPIMNGYSGAGCEAMDTGYDGWERTLLLGANFDSVGSITVELVEDDAGSEYVDVVELDYDAGLCWPGACVASGLMSEDGQAEMEMQLVKDATNVLVFDGRDSYSDDVWVTAQCEGKYPEAFCMDGADDDGDGSIDCCDSDCAGHPSCDGECSCTDGVDNDGDNDVDCDDSDCSDAVACQPEAVCDDGEDNDLDGATDCEDSDCAGQGDCAAGASCPDATPLLCGSELFGESLAGGSTYFADKPISGCAGLANTTSTYSEFPHRIYQVTADEGCVVDMVYLQNSSGFFDMYGLAPGCDGDSCVDANFWYTDIPITLDAASGWVGVFLSNGSTASLVDDTYDISVLCKCE